MNAEVEEHVEERVEEEVEIKLPKLWRVILHNDNKTTIEFVVLLLMNVFHKGTHEATELTLQIHQEGAAIAGVYPHEIAENKMRVCIDAARGKGYPLKVTIEEEE